MSEVPCLSFPDMADHEPTLYKVCTVHKLYERRNVLLVEVKEHSATHGAALILPVVVGSRQLSDSYYSALPM